MSDAKTRWRDHGIGAGVLAVVLGLGWMGVLAPSLTGAGQAVDLDREAAEIRRNVEQQTTLLDSQTALVAQLEAQLQQNERREAGSVSLNERIAALGRDAESCGLTLSKLDAAGQGSGPARGPGRRQIELEGEGTFPGVAAFLAVIHDRSPDCVVERFSVQRSVSGGVRFSVRVLWIAPAGGG